MQRLPTTTFISKWCPRNGVFIDSESVSIRQAISSSSSSKNKQKQQQKQETKKQVSAACEGGLGLFAKKSIEAGSLFAIIPQHATLQTHQLSNFSVDENVKSADSSVLPLAVRSIVRGSDIEHPWWELAVLVALYKSVPQEILEKYSILEQQQEQNEEKVTKHQTENSSGEEKEKEQETEEKEQEKNKFSGYLDFLPPTSPQQLLSQNEHEILSRLPGQVKKDFEFNRSQNMLKSARLVRDIPLLSKCCYPHVTPQIMLWSYEMVTSRANNFSFLKSTTELRPYGLSPAPIFGQEPTMCPVFDIMNHVADTNVLVADTLIHSGKEEEEDQEKENNNTSNSSSSFNLAPLKTEHFTPSIVLGALRNIKAGEEIGYGYAATPDVAFSLTRWGFSPNSPL